MRSPPLRRETTCEKHDLVQSGKSSLMTWPDVKLIPQTNKQTNKYVLSFDMPTPLQHVKCAYVRLPVEEYTPNPMRCFKCQKYGHTTNKCNSQVACGRCGTNEQDHSTRECRGKPYCVNSPRGDPGWGLLMEPPGNE